MIAKILKLKLAEDKKVLSKFTDAKSLPQWSRGAVSAVLVKGCMVGYPDQTFKADNPVTRAETIAILYRGTVTMTGTATSQVTRPFTISIYIKSGAVTEVGGIDSEAINVYIRPSP